MHAEELYINTKHKKVSRFFFHSGQKVKPRSTEVTELNGDFSHFFSELEVATSSQLCKYHLECTLYHGRTLQEYTL